MVDGLPSGAVGEMFPVVVMTTAVGIVPKGTADVIVVGDIVVVDAVIVAVVPGMDVERVLMTVDCAGMGFPYWTATAGAGAAAALVWACRENR